MNMSNKVEFIVMQDHDLKVVRPKGKQYVLLSYFLGTFRTKWDLPVLTNGLEQVAKGEKTFDEVQDPNGYLSFGEGSGYLECEDGTAYFISNDTETLPSMEMPLKELVQLMKEWQALLGL